MLKTKSGKVIGNTPARVVMTVPEAGALLGLSREASYVAAKNGEIPTIRIGNLLKVPVVRFEAMLAQDRRWQKRNIRNARLNSESVAALHDMLERKLREISNRAAALSGEIGHEHGDVLGHLTADIAQLQAVVETLRDRHRFRNA